MQTCLGSLTLHTLALGARLPETLHIVHVCQVSGHRLAKFQLDHHSVLLVARHPVGESHIASCVSRHQEQCDFA